MTMEERIARLEHHNRVWRRVALGSALAAAALLIWSNGLIGPPIRSFSAEAHAAEEDAANAERVYEKIRLRRLEIVDHTGKTVAIMTGGPGGSHLAMRSSGGEKLVTLHSANGEGAVLQVRGEEGTIKLTDQGIAVNPADHERRARFKEKLLASGQILTEEERLWLPNIGYVEDPAVEIGFSKQGGGMINLYKIVVSVQANKANEGAVYVNDVNGNLGNVLVPK